MIEWYEKHRGNGRIKAAVLSFHIFNQVIHENMEEDSKDDVYSIHVILQNEAKYQRVIFSKVLILNVAKDEAERNWDEDAG